MQGLVIRPMKLKDYGFVKATWLRHFKEHSDYARPMKNSVFFPAHAKLVDNAIARPTTFSVVAIHPDEPDVCLGFLVYEEQDVPVLHFAYVIEQARKLGIAKQMLAHVKLALPCVYTHRTHDMKSFCESHPGMVYDPYRI